jgi:hypothetical protein
MPPTQRQTPASATPETLAAALAALQADMPKVVKDKTARVPTKNGGEYTYKYSDLSTVSEALLPILGKYGLSFSAKPTMTDSHIFVLHYLLRHASGEADEGFYPLPDPTTNGAQAIGSAITYARRYALCAVTGLAADVDDDGAAANDARATRRSQREEDPYSPPVGAGAAPRDWLAEAAEITDEAALLDLGRQASAAGEFKGEVKTGLLKRRQELQAKAAEAAAQAAAE